MILVLLDISEYNVWEGLALLKGDTGGKESCTGYRQPFNAG